MIDHDENDEPTDKEVLEATLEEQRSFYLEMCEEMRNFLNDHLDAFEDDNISGSDNPSVLTASEMIEILDNTIEL